MLFNSAAFLLIYLPLVLAGFYLCPLRWRLPFLTLASIVFYGLSGPIPMLFLVASMIWAFFWARFVGQIPRSWLTLISVAFPLWTLFMFRYLDFTFTTFGTGPETRAQFSFFLDVLLPAGISFYTFQIISYSIDVLDGRQKVERNFFQLAAYISFFPQLIAGPILRYEQIREQLVGLATVRKVPADWVGGIKFICVGVFAKTFIADFLGILVERLDVPSNGSSLDGTLSLFAYSFQIYYDFWAYSIIAIGLAKLFGITLPRNFAEPYKALNPRDFWRRWHMTLSYWLRDYVYIKLGGNKAYVRNIAIVFAAVGLWHGAGWNFVAWGLYHAVLVIGYHFSRPIWDAAPRLLQVAVTFALVSLGWPLFYLDFGGYIELTRQIFVTGAFEMVVYGVKEWVFLAVVALWTFGPSETRWLFNESRRTILDRATIQACMLFGAMLFFVFARTFIYFRF